MYKLSNLQRQILYNDHSIGTHKAESAAQAIRRYDPFFHHSHFLPSPRINPRVKADPVPASLSPSNAVELLSSYDVILDCTDNAPTRYLLSDTAVILGKPR
jgi:adenylyltransferase and sulfurtransferase